MEKLNFDNLEKCKDLFYYECELFEFRYGLIINGKYYPMPCNVRKMLQRNFSVYSGKLDKRYVINPLYSKVFNYSKESLQNFKGKRITSFNYSIYADGVKDGFKGCKFTDKNQILNFACQYKRTDKQPSPIYFLVDGSVSNENAEQYGLYVGKLYYCWSEICNNIDDYIKIWEDLKNPKTESNDFFTTPLNQVRMKAIHQYLSTEKKYIDVDVDSWLYWFNLQSWTNKRKNPQSIKWLAASYILSNVVFIICGNFTNDTESIMKKVFVLPKDANFGSLKRDLINRAKVPYKKLYEKIEMAEHSI